MKASEIREKLDVELERMLQDRTDELMHFRIQQATGVIDNVRSAREARRDVARIKTILNERKRAQAKS
jgi:large subunit ribosomal protein L29